MSYSIYRDCLMVGQDTSLSTPIPRHEPIHGAALGKKGDLSAGPQSKIAPKLVIPSLQPKPLLDMAAVVSIRARPESQSGRGVSELGDAKLR